MCVKPLKYLLQFFGLLVNARQVEEGEGWGGVYVWNICSDWNIELKHISMMVTNKYRSFWKIVQFPRKNF